MFAGRPLPRRLTRRGGLVGLLALLCLTAIGVGVQSGLVAAEQERIAVRLPDGRCTVRLADPMAIDQIERRLAMEAAELRRLSARLAGDSVAARLAGVREAVPAFGAWAFGWWESYGTTLRALASGMREAMQADAPDAAPDRFLAGMAEPMRLAFRDRALAGGDALLAQDLRHLGTLLDRRWQAALGEAGARLALLPEASGGASARLDLAAAARPIAAEVAGAAPPTADRLVALMGDADDSTDALLRPSIRPLAVRLGVGLLRVSEAGSLVATGGVIGYATAGGPGLAAGTALGVGAAWAVDWAINQADAALNRPVFETQLLAAIARMEQRLVASAAAAAGTALDARLASLRVDGAGCP